MDMGMQQEHEHTACTGKCSKGINMHLGHGPAAWTWIQGMVMNMTCRMDINKEENLTLPATQTVKQI
jgi:hypothetical protein